MRVPAALGALLMVMLRPPVATAMADTTVLIDAGHALDGRTATITGLVRNTGRRALQGLVIDADGYGPDGELVAAGTDGIPWPLHPGAVERFRISLPLGPDLIREYVVRAAVAGTSRVLAVTRGAVDAEEYRVHLRTLVVVEGTTRGGRLTVRAHSAGLPVSQVTVRANLWALDPLVTQFELVSLHLDVPGDRWTTVVVSPALAILLSLQIVDVRLRAHWTR